MEKILDQLGRLIAYTRQLDAGLDADETVAGLVKKFLAGDYGVDGSSLSGHVHKYDVVAYHMFLQEQR